MPLRLRFDRLSVVRYGRLMEYHVAIVRCAVCGCEGGQPVYSRRAHACSDDGIASGEAESEAAWSLWNSLRSRLLRAYFPLNFTNVSWFILPDWYW